MFSQYIIFINTNLIKLSYNHNNCTLYTILKNQGDFMKRRIFAIALTLIISVGQLCSCFLTDTGEKYLTEADVLNMIGNIESGSVNNVNITVEGTNDVISASRAVLSTVSIRCEFDTKYYYYFPYAQTVSKTETSGGSGVIYSLDKEKGDAYIITNYHVVYHSKSTAENKISDKINLYLYGMEYDKYAIPATYIGGSMAYDLAVLKVEGSEVLKSGNALAAVFENSDAVSVLETAIIVGNPNGMSATAGYINIDSEYISMVAPDNVTTIEMRVMRTSAPVNSGNSGGGLYNAEGKLLGIVNAKKVADGTDNVGYAIPSNVAKYVTENIIANCDGKENESVYKCILDINVGIAASRTEYDEVSARITKIETVILSQVSSSGAAAGKLRVGDIVKALTVDGVKHEITRSFQVIDLMINAGVGETVEFGLIRNGEEVNVSIEITEQMMSKIV